MPLDLQSLLETLGGMGGGIPTSFAPTAEQAQPDREALMQQAYGYTPTAEPPKHPILEALQTAIAGFSDAKAAHGLALTGRGVEPTSLALLDALRLRRKQMRKQKGAHGEAYKREGAKAQIAQLDKQDAEARRKQDILEERKFQGEIHTQDLKDQRDFAAQQREDQQAFEAQQTAERLKNEQMDRDLRKTISEKENAMRLKIAMLDQGDGTKPDKVAARQVAEEQRKNLSEAKGYALVLKEQVAAGKTDVAAARQRYQDRVEIDLDGEALEAAMAWFDLKVGRPTSTATEAAPPVPREPPPPISNKQPKPGR